MPIVNRIETLIDASRDEVALAAAATKATAIATQIETNVIKDHCVPSTNATRIVMGVQRDLKENSYRTPQAIVGCPKCGLGMSKATIQYLPPCATNEANQVMWP